MVGRITHESLTVDTSRCARQVICNGEEVLQLGGVKSEYVVDIWSGNHPFFQGNTNVMVVDEGRVNRFSRR